MTNNASPSTALHWLVSTALLCVACLAVAWLTSRSAESWHSFSEVLPVWFALVILLGMSPFYMRRNYDFNLVGLLVVSGVGVGMAALGWLLGFNMIVFVWMGMTWVLLRVARPTARGNMVTHNIQLEQSASKSIFPTKTEQHERLLFLYDFAMVLLVILALLALSWRYSR